MEYKLRLSGVAPKLFPTESFFALLYNGTEQPMELPKEMPFSGDWGRSVSVWEPDTETFPLPCAIDMVWLSITEQVFYSVEKPLPIDKLKSLFSKENEDLYDNIIIGMAPYGGLALWLSGKKKTTLLTWLKGESTSVDISDFLPENPNVTLQDYCNFYFDNNPVVKENLQTNGLPPRDLFDNYMKQFTYRYLPLFEHWDENEEEWRKYTDEEQEIKPEFEYIEEALYDGTYDKQHDGGLLSYHEAGKPNKLAVKWHIKKSEYTAYFWFEDEAIRAIFDKFYGIHPETKTDLIIHIDPEKKKYQLALFRYGLQEPRIIPEEAYQLIVFKNKFEHFRSDNYDQPSGAWIW